VCCKKVNTHHQAFECDVCHAWVHRLCGTGFSQSEYWEIARRLRDGGCFQWQCSDCRAKPPSPDQPLQHDDVSDALPDISVTGELGPPVSDSTHVSEVASRDT